MNTTSPQVGAKVRATTTTPTEQQVIIEVSAIDRETETGWYVYGYRNHRGSRPRQTMYPSLYFVARQMPPLASQVVRREREQAEGPDGNE